MGKCKNCGNDNLVECKLIAGSYVRIKIPGQMLSTSILCQMCSDCGEINRLYTKKKPNGVNK